MALAAGAQPRRGLLGHRAQEVEQQGTLPGAGFAGSGTSFPLGGVTVTAPPLPPPPTPMYPYPSTPPPSLPNGGWGGIGGSLYATASGGSTSFSNFNVSNVYPANGNKPLAEYRDKCSGAQGLWNLGVANNNAETVGVITADGQLIIVAIVGVAGGALGGLYHQDTGTGPGRDYYTWPATQGAPTQTYAGMIPAAGQYFIPIVATVHTHTPCLGNGTNGISNMTLSDGDRALAAGFSHLTHYIIGCDALGTFSTASTSPRLLQTGPLSATCARL